jgi:lysyl-tRNA synthetase class 2
VETPILWSSVGGASARPFLTKANALGNAPLSLRIAPELFLKVPMLPGFHSLDCSVDIELSYVQQLVIGGFERVYEMSRVFRNEGIDATHNPEFSTCELYWAYADCASLIPFTEELLRRMVTELLGKSTLQLPWATETTNIDFAPAFQRIDIVPALCAALGVQSLPLDGLNRNDKQAIDELIELAKRAGSMGKFHHVFEKSSFFHRIVYFRCPCF